MAGVNVGTAWVTLAASAKGIGKGIEKDLKGAGTKAGEGFGKEFNTGATKSVSGATTSLSSFGTTAIVGAAAVGAAFFGLASAAGDLSAAVAANEQVMGDASGAIQDFAATGVESVGLSETAILNAATSFGQLGKVVGLTGDDLSTFSLDLVTLAADMAAFKNVTPTQALEDLQSAFAGQPEVLRKYGVFLDEGTLKQALFAETGERVTGVLTPQQRILATNIELFRQTADIQGQAARESGGFERSVANLKATMSNIAADFGAPIVGFASTFLGLIGDGLGKVSEWNTELGGMLFTGLAAGIGVAAVASAAVGIGSKIKGAVDAFKGLNKGLQIATGVVGGLALAVTAGFVVYGLLTKHSREVAARTAEVADALDEATAEAWDYAEAAAGASGEVDGFAVAQHAMSIALVGTGEDGEKLTEALGTLGVQTEDVADIFLALGQDPVQALTDLAEASGAVGGNAEILGQYVDEIERLGSGPAFSNLIDREFSGNSEAAEAWVLRNGEVISSMREVQRQAGLVDLNEVAQQFLQHAVAASDDAEALVVQAEAQSGASRNGEHAQSVYRALQEILAELPPVERDAALEALGLASATGDVAAAVEETNDVAASTIDTTSDLADAFDEAADRASAFSSALDSVINPAKDLQESEDQLIAGTRELADVIHRAQAGEEGYSLSLDQNTEAGRENREMIRSRVDDIMTNVDAMIAEGASVDEVTRQYNFQREALIRQVMAFGLTEDAAIAYVNSIGLVPDAVDTAITLSNEEVAKAAIEAHLAELGDIPEEVATAVQVAVDAGDYARAESMLAQLEKDRYADVFIRTHGSTGTSSKNPYAVAYGGYFPGNQLQPLITGDAPWDEAMLTVGNLANLRRQLTDPRISGPILEALPQVEPMMSSGSGWRRGRGDINVVSYEQNPTPAGVAAAIRMAGVG